MGSAMDSDDSLELSLGAERQCYIPPSITQFLNHLSRIRDVSERLAELNDYVSNLEQEMRKLDALKRNPQRCMSILKDAVEFLKREGEKMKREVDSEEHKRPVLKEFLPLKRSFNGEEHREEEKLMDFHNDKRHKSSIAIPAPCKLSIGGGGGGGGAFTPFKATMAEEPVLSLFPPGTQKSRPQLGNSHLLPEPNIKAKRLELGYDYGDPQTNDKGKGDAYHQAFNLQGVQQHQTVWKNNRRCWSPELHARFMAAMDFLGGPEVATPKQIRAIMQVEGLTNDQVKSHLQKYRLHNRGQQVEDSDPANPQANFQEPWRAGNHSDNCWSTRRNARLA